MQALPLSLLLPLSRLLTQLSPSVSVGTYASSSFSSLLPDTFKYERLRGEYRRSQERLRIKREQHQAEQEHFEAQRSLYERERVARDAAHREELERVRRQYEDDAASGKGKGKRRK